MIHRRLSGLPCVVNVCEDDSDVRELETLAQPGHEGATLALEMYADRVRSSIGSLATTLGVIDALIFTAGVEENSARIQAAVCQGLECLDLKLEEGRNTIAKPDTNIAGPDSRASILVLVSKENSMIAREVTRVIMLSGD
jgi:acetate kinase